MVFELHDQGESLTATTESLTSVGVLTKSENEMSTATIGDMIKRKTFYQEYITTQKTIETIRVGSNFGGTAYLPSYWLSSVSPSH